MLLTGFCLLRWRMATGMMLFALIGLPLAHPLIHLLFNSQAWFAWRETEVARLRVMVHRRPAAELQPTVGILGLHGTSPFIERDDGRPERYYSWNNRAVQSGAWSSCMHRSRI